MMCKSIWPLNHTFNGLSLSSVSITVRCFSNSLCLIAFDPSSDVVEIHWLELLKGVPANPMDSTLPNEATDLRIVIRASVGDVYPHICVLCSGV